MVKFVDNERRRASDILARASSKKRRRIGATLAAVIERRGLTQKDVADYLGISRSTVAHWCTDRFSPNEQTLGRIALCLGVAPSFFLCHDPDLIAQLTRATAPGAFLSAEEDAAVREAEHAAREAARIARAEDDRIRKENKDQREAVRQAKADRIEEEKARTAVLRRLQSPGVQDNWRARVAASGKRCMVCATALRAPGICADCSLLSRDERREKFGT